MMNKYNQDDHTSGKLLPAHRDGEPINGGSAVECSSSSGHDKENGGDDANTDRQKEN